MASKAKKSIADDSHKSNSEAPQGIVEASEGWHALNVQAAAMRKMELWHNEDQARYDGLLREMEPLERRVIAYGTHHLALEVSKIKSRLLLATHKAGRPVKATDAVLVAMAILDVE